MLPTKLNHPHFVPDQLLSADHLNQVFEFLDEQGRMTRTNLIGMGIVCGLEPSLSADGTEITLSAGVGITSHGHLISMPQRTLSRRKDYPVNREYVYGPFLDEDRNPLFAVEELVEESQAEGALPFDRTHLAGKQLVLFVELEARDAKNCSPDSCDDKGRQIHWNLRVLLIPRDALNPALGAGEGSPSQTLPNLPWIRLPRFDVEATSLVDSAALIGAYQKILQPDYLADWESRLREAYVLLSPWVHDLFSSNPFEGFAERFKPVMAGSTDLFELIHIQYYYGFLSDVVEAYEALRIEGSQLMAQCLPDEDLFPRHLLLGLADPAEADAQTSAYRHGFIPSAALCGCGSRVSGIRLLMRRLAEMVRGFSIPRGGKEAWTRAGAQQTVKITPSRLGTYSLEGKAIPYYYDPRNPEEPLFQIWDSRLGRQGRANQTLSYHSGFYNTQDDWVARPCAYDLEPYNFLRIEGHIGLPVHQAMEQVQAIKHGFRLPFEPIALGADLRSLAVALRQIRAGNFEDLGDWAQSPCQFTELQTMYSSLRSALICKLCKELKYYYALGGTQGGDPSRMEIPGQAPQVPLFALCDPGFLYYPGSLGAYFEVYYAQASAHSYAAMGAFYASMGQFTHLQTSSTLLGLMYLIHELGMSLPENLEEFDYRKFRQIDEQMRQLAAEIKKALEASGQSSQMDVEDIRDHLDLLIYLCAGAELRTLMESFLERKAYVYFLGKLGYFVRKHPGIQHKGGVPMGGTFLMVYHELPRSIPQKENAAGQIAGTKILGNNAGGQQTVQAEEKYRLSQMEDMGLKPQGGSLRINADYMADYGLDAQQAVQVDQNKTQIVRDKGLRIQEETIRRIQEDLAAERPQAQKELDTPLENLQPGTVIADFYLPYLCYSDCPPIQFLWTPPREEPKGEAPRLEMEFREYCHADDATYPVKLSPQGGELSGPGLIREADGTWGFQPFMVDMGQETVRGIELVYKTESGEASLKLKVYAMPKDRIVAKVGSDPLIWGFRTATGAGEKWLWEFGDGHQSEKPSPEHRYEKGGEYTVQLHIWNGPCREILQTQITVGEKPQPQPRACMPLSGLYTRIVQLEHDYPNAYPAYLKGNKGLGAFSKLIFEWQSQLPQEEIEFLLGKEWGKVSADWIQETQEWMSNSEFKYIALDHFGMLMDMVIYLTCRLDGRITGAESKLNLPRIYDMLNKILRSWSKWKPDAVRNPILVAMIERLKIEVERRDQQGWSEEAEKYFQILEEWISLIHTLVKK